MMPVKPNKSRRMPTPSSATRPFPQKGRCKIPRKRNPLVRKEQS